MKLIKINVISFDILEEKDFKNDSMPYFLNIDKIEAVSEIKDIKFKSSKNTYKYFTVLTNNKTFILNSNEYENVYNNIILPHLLPITT